MRISCQAGKWRFFRAARSGMAMIPVLTQTLTLRGRESAWNLFSCVANLAFIVTGIGAALAALFALPIVRFASCPASVRSSNYSPWD